MYQTFVNCEEEFAFCSSLLKKYLCESVVEAGCGNSNLAHRFADGHFNYVGMDLSDDMLDIAKENNPHTDFIKGDMRNFDLPGPMQPCIITGRSISYLLSDDDLRDAFQSIHKNLTEPAFFVLISSTHQNFFHQ
jgi:SAM-dependent methyltransferase